MKEAEDRVVEGDRVGEGSQTQLLADWRSFVGSVLIDPLSLRHCEVSMAAVLRDKYDAMYESLKWKLFEVCGGWERAREIQEAGGCRI